MRFLPYAVFMSDAIRLAILVSARESSAVPMRTSTGTEAAAWGAWEAEAAGGALQAVAWKEALLVEEVALWEEEEAQVELVGVEAEGAVMMLEVDWFRRGLGPTRF